MSFLLAVRSTFVGVRAVGVRRPGGSGGVGGGSAVVGGDDDTGDGSEVFAGRGIRVET